MEQLWSLIDYFREHPTVAAGAAVGLVLLYFLLNRKPRMVREADEHLKVLRKEKKAEGHYDKSRPLR